MKNHRGQGDIRLVYVQPPEPKDTSRDLQGETSDDGMRDYLKEGEYEMLLAGTHPS